MPKILTLLAVVGEDRRLIIDLPLDVPVGPIELTIRPLPEVVATAASSPTTEREIIRAKLRAAGLLSVVRYAADDARPLSEEDRVRIGTLAPGARPSEELIAEDRGPY